MTTNETNTLGVSAIDRVLPAEYEILKPTDPRNENRAALRAVRHRTGGLTHYFTSMQEYFSFPTLVIPRQRLLAEEYGTRYIQLSAQYDSDPYFHAGLTHTVAAFTHRSVVIHRLKSDETAVRMEFSAEEMAALVEGCQSYLAEIEGSTASPECDPFADIPGEHG
jgi:hypothetical protein